MWIDRAPTVREVKNHADKYAIDGKSAGLWIVFKKRYSNPVHWGISLPEFVAMRVVNSQIEQAHLGEWYVCSLDFKCCLPCTPEGVPVL